MLKNKYIFIRNIVLLLIVCNTLYWLFPVRPIVWRVLLVIISVFVAVMKHNKLACEKAVLVFATLNVIHFMVSFLWMTPSLTMIGNILCAMLSLGLFTCLSEHGVMTHRFIAFAGLVLLVAAIPYYYHTQLLVLKALINADMSKDITNNGSTIFLMLLPIVFLLKSNVQKWVTLMICLFFIVLSSKRGNILAAILPTLLFAYVALRTGKQSILRIVAVFIAIYVAGYFIYDWVINNDYLLYRLEQTAERNTSGREVIYSAAWNAWLNADSIINILCGYGYEGTMSITSMNHLHAHSDWLEILVDYGLIGVFIYLAMFFFLYQQIRRTKTFEIKIALIVTVLIWFFKTIYSMGFTESNMPILMMTLGTSLGWYKREKTNHEANTFFS